MFLFTIVETLVSTWEGRADRQSTSAKHNRFSIRASWWAAVFEALLLIEILLAVSNPWVIAPAVILGAWIGKFWSLERRRKRFRSRVRRRRAAPAIPPTSSPSSTSGTSP